MQSTVQPPWAGEQCHQFDQSQMMSQCVPVPSASFAPQVAKESLLNFPHLSLSLSISLLITTTAGILDIGFAFEVLQAVGLGVWGARNQCMSTIRLSRRTLGVCHVHQKQRELRATESMDKMELSSWRNSQG